MPTHSDIEASNMLTIALSARDEFTRPDGDTFPLLSVRYEIGDGVATFRPADIDESTSARDAEAGGSGYDVIHLTDAAGRKHTVLIAVRDPVLSAQGMIALVHCPDDRVAVIDMSKGPLTGQPSRSEI